MAHSPPVRCRAGSLAGRRSVAMPHSAHKKRTSLINMLRRTQRGASNPLASDPPTILFSPISTQACAASRLHRANTRRRSRLAMPLPARRRMRCQRARNKVRSFRVSRRSTRPPRYPAHFIDRENNGGPRRLAHVKMRAVTRRTATQDDMTAASAVDTPHGLRLHRSSPD